MSTALKRFPLEGRLREMPKFYARPPRLNCLARSGLAQPTICNCLTPLHCPGIQRPCLVLSIHLYHQGIPVSFLCVGKKRKNSAICRCFSGKPKPHIPNFQSYKYGFASFFSAYSFPFSSHQSELSVPCSSSLQPNQLHLHSKKY